MKTYSTNIVKNILFFVGWSRFSWTTVHLGNKQCQLVRCGSVSSLTWSGTRIIYHHLYCEFQWNLYFIYFKFWINLLKYISFMRQCNQVNWDEVIIFYIVIYFWSLIPNWVEWDRMVKLLHGLLKTLFSGWHILDCMFAEQTTMK